MNTQEGTVLDWLQRAACAGANPDLFFPGRGASLAPARAVCMGCPVRVDCLNDALRSHETHGVRGGLSERERAELRRELVAAGELPRTCANCGADVAASTARGYAYCSAECETTHRNATPRRAREHRRRRVAS